MTNQDPTTTITWRGKGRLVLALLASTALISVAGSTFAANWTGISTTDWLDPANWSNNTVPDSAESVSIDGPVQSVTIIGVGSDATANTVSVGPDSTGGLTILDGATLRAGGLDLGLNAGALGLLGVDGAGSLLDYGNNLYVANHGTSVVNLTGGGHMQGNGGSIGEGSNALGVVNVDGAGSLWSMDFNLTVANKGTGTLNITNGGQVTSQTGSIAYVLDSDGTVVIDGAGSSWDMTGQLDLAHAGLGVLTLSNGGEISASDISVAATVDGVGTILIGALPGDPAAAAGTINAPTIIFGSGNGGIFFNHTDTDYQVDADMMGYGLISHYGGHTTLTGNSAGFTGSASVVGGTLSVNGLFGGLVDVSGSGTLGGTGSVAELSAHGGGTIAPGGSAGSPIGALHATTAGFHAGSLFAVDVDAAGNSDALNVGDIAGIDSGSTVSVRAKPGVYGPSTQYTLITAGTMLDGTFDSVTSDLAFLTPTLSYDPTHAYLTLTLNGVSLVDVATTPNQIAAATGVSNLGSGNPIYDGLIGLTVPEANAAFDALSGEVHAAYKGVLFDDSRLLRGIVLARASADLRGPAAAEEAANGGGLGLWSTGYGALTTIQDDGNAASSAESTGGFVLGADGKISGWNVGLLANLGLSAMGDPARDSTAASADFGGGVYASTGFAGTGLSFGFTYVRHAINTTRHAAFPGFDDTLRADYAAGTGQAFAELSHKLQLRAVTLEPFANLTYLSHTTESFRESGGSAALSGVADTQEAALTTLGLRASTIFIAGALPVTASGGLSWRHTFGSAPAATNNFAGGTPFTVLGVAANAEAALVDAGLRAGLGLTSTLSLSYSGELGARQQSHAVKIGLAGSF